MRERFGLLDPAGPIRAAGDKVLVSCG